MKNFVKFLIIVGLSILLGWAVFTQTQRGQDYVRNHLSPDADFIRSQLLNALDATGVMITGELPSLSGDILQYSTTGAILVDQTTLNKRLEYYKKSKEQLWK